MVAILFVLAALLLVSGAALHSCGGAYENVGGRLPSERLAGLPPFSFQLGASSSDDVLSRSSSTSSTTVLDADRNETVTVFYDASTFLVTTLTVVTYANILASTSASEWFLTFANNGSAAATPPLCAVYGVNMSFLDSAPSPSAATEVRRYQGSNCSSSDYAALNETLVGGPSGGSNYTWFFPAGGRSSDGILPFFSAFNAAVGYTFSVGWSGSWTAAVRRGDAAGAGNASSVWIRHDTQDGSCPGVCTPLRPGESFRSMRILMVSWPADNADSYHQGVNAHRRILARYKVPRGAGAGGSGAVLGALTSSLGWWGLPNCPNASYASQAALLQGVIASAPAVEAFWLDASWFNGCFPSGVGNWQLPLAAVIDQVEFPNASLAQLGVVAHAAAPTPVKFILWVEPERVAPGTYIATTHADFLIPDAASDLLNLGNATVRAYMTAFLSALVAELRLDVLRLDFNTAPGPNWAATDAPGRDGATQLAYVAGLYAMWDDILAGAPPGLLIDNCASGGRRIDLETLSRSVPLWRSDSAAPGQPPEEQMIQTMGLSGFAPVHAGTTYSYEPYYWRATGSVGHTAIDFPWPLLLANATEMATLRAAQAETLRLRPLSIFGDYYPLAPIVRNDAACTAWQHHCDGADACGGRIAGALHIFRGPAAPQACALNPFAIELSASYQVDFYYSYELDHSGSMTGAQLAAVNANMSAGYSTSLLLQYTCSSGCA